MRGTCHHAEIVHRKALVDPLQNFCGHFAQRVDIAAFVALTEGNNATDKLINTLVSLPGLLRVAVNLLKWMDWHNLLPKAIIDASPMHNSMVFTNLASIRTNHIYHHCYDFGTTSIIMAAGNPREVPRRLRTGEIIHEKCLPLGVVMDERIASGYYFASAFRRMKEYLKNPALLEEPPEKIITDPEI